MFVSGALQPGHSGSSGAGFARIIALIRSAIRDSMPVTRYVSANLANSTAVVIETSGALSKHHLAKAHPLYKHL